MDDTGLLAEMRAYVAQIEQDLRESKENGSYLDVMATSSAVNAAARCLAIAERNVLPALAASQANEKLLAYKLTDARKALAHQAKSYLGERPPTELDRVVANTKIRSKLSRAVAAAEVGQLRSAFDALRALVEADQKTDAQAFADSEQRIAAGQALQEALAVARERVKL